MRIAMIAAALTLGAPPAMAQDAGNTMPDPGTPNGMVNVSVPNVDVLGGFVSKDQAASLKDSLPTTIQLPIGIAASACGIEASDLAKAKKGSVPSCTARNGSRDLAEHVLKAAKSPPKE